MRAGRGHRRHPPARADDRPQLRVDPDGRRLPDRVHLRPPYRPVWTRGPMIARRRRRRRPAAPSIPGTDQLRRRGVGFAGWAENTMGSMASAISPGALSLPQLRRRIPQPQRRRPRGRRVLPGPGRSRHQRRQAAGAAVAPAPVPAAPAPAPVPAGGGSGEARGACPELVRQCNCRTNGLPLAASQRRGQRLRPYDT